MQRGRATGCLVVGSLTIAANKIKAKNCIQKNIFLLAGSQKG
jgi:hypothetical protein